MKICLGSEVEYLTGNLPGKKKQAESVGCIFQKRVTSFSFSEPQLAQSASIGSLRSFSVSR
jgi:hypothetical protein